MSWRIRQVHVLIVVAVVSCDLPDGVESGPAAATPQSKDTRTLSVQTKLDPALKALVDTATASLVERLAEQKLDAKDVAVLQAERVTWRSGALGCPMPDRGYKMVLTPGILIRLHAAGTTYEYHSTLRGPPFLCEPPGRIETPAPGGNSQDPI